MTRVQSAHDKTADEAVGAELVVGSNATKGWDLVEYIKGMMKRYATDPPDGIASCLIEMNAFEDQCGVR